MINTPRPEHTHSTRAWLSEQSAQMAIRDAAYPGAEHCPGDANSSAAQARTGVFRGSDEPAGARGSGESLGGRAAIPT